MHVARLPRFTRLECLAAQAKGSGRPRTKTKFRRIAFDILEKVTQRSCLAEKAAEVVNNSLQYRKSPGLSLNEEAALLKLRFPSVEFRALCINPLGRSTDMPAFPDKGTWNRHKQELASLCLMLAEEHPGFQDALQKLVATSLEKDRWQLTKAQRDKRLSAEQCQLLDRRFEARLVRVQAQYEAWCRATVETPSFAVIRPMLQQVLGIEPAPLADNKRDGQHTEAAVTDLLWRELPAGWSMFSQARMVAVDGEPYRNVKMLKGEADVLLVDPQGIVQAILEIKTAKGNPYLALYEDVQRLNNMTERVQGRLVSFVPSSISGSSSSSSGAGMSSVSSSAATAPRQGSSPSGAVGDTGLVGGGVPAGLSSSGGDGEGAATDSGAGQPMVTLRFSKTVKPVYVLGSTIPAEDMDAVVRSAHSKLLCMEYGRILSTQMAAWRDVSLVEVNREAAILQVPLDSIPQCAQNVRKYFEVLQNCDIYMTQI